MRSCKGLKSRLPAKAGIVELCAIFVAADLNILRLVHCSLPSCFGGLVVAVLVEQV